MLHIQTADQPGSSVEFKIVEPHNSVGSSVPVKASEFIVSPSSLLIMNVNSQTWSEPVSAPLPNLVPQPLTDIVSQPLPDSVSQSLSDIEPSALLDAMPQSY